jgi:serine/threonine protein phosphatase PrpC
MEDAHICQSINLPGDKLGTIFGVFDGHGGKEVAVFA